MAVETNARIEFSVASVEEWEKVNPKLHQGEPVFAKKPSGKYILKVGAPGGSTYKNAVVVWDQDDAETKMTSTQEAAAQALASKNAASASASAAKASENAAAASKSAAATSAENAKTSETNAAASKTAAANSASTASANATASANSSSAAATSEKNAAGSASAAATSESNALKSASAASTSAGNAKSSETNAFASASAAKASENAAAASKSAAATSAENAKTSETNAAASANTAKAWSMSDSSPDGVSGNKSSKTWSEESKTSAGNSAASASASQSSATASASSATNSANSANASKQSAIASANSAAASASSASEATTSASNAKVSETNADNSAKAAKQSEKNAKTWDPTQYVQSVTESNGKVTVTKGGGETNTFDAGLTKEQLTNFFYPIGSVYVSADKSKTKADFPFMTYGIWEEIPANLCLQTGADSEAGTQRSAGLPNITGELFVAPGTNSIQVLRDGSGALSAAELSTKNNSDNIALNNYGRHLKHHVTFDASQSNPVYGSSDTVQPPAYIVRAWVRTA